MWWMSGVGGVRGGRGKWRVGEGGREHTDVQAETAHGAAAGPVAVDVLDEHVVCRVLDRDALVPVGHLDVVDPDVGARHVDAVEPALVAATDDCIVQLAVGAAVEGEVKLWC